MKSATDSAVLTRPTTADGPTYGAVPVAATVATWLLAIAAAGLLAARAAGVLPGLAGPLVVVDGLTVLLWAAIGVFSGLVHSFALRYLAGWRWRGAFYGNAIAFTFSAALFVASNHFALLLAAWLGMGWAISRLIGRDRDSAEARAAGRACRRRFLVGAGLLLLGLGALFAATGAVTTTGAAAALGERAGPLAVVGAVLIAGAAAIQAALVPFHGWLLSSMTAPTPASALMHAGFVNAGAVLFARFAPLFGAEAWLLGVLCVLGGASALLGKAMKSQQPDVKRQLACSTVGQMGFMVLQAGLGLFSAAVAHLILHGLYKGYLFLGVGGRVDDVPAEPEAAPGAAARAGTLLGSLAAGALGAWLFLAWTGKGVGLDAGLVLAVFVAFTVAHAARVIGRDPTLPPAVRFLGPVVVFFPLLALYAAVYRAVSGLLQPLPGLDSPVALGPIHGLLVAIFAASYLALEAGWLERSRWLYVRLLNLAQPLPTAWFPRRGEA